MKIRERDKTGRYVPTEGANNVQLNIRISKHLYEEIKKVAGEKVAPWVREAILQRLEKEKCDEGNSYNEKDVA